MGRRGRSESRRCLPRRCRRITALSVLLVTLGLAAPMSLAHQLQPAYLEIREVSRDRFEVLWKVPLVAGVPMRLAARLPSSCRELRPPAATLSQRDYTERWLSACDGGLVGGTISVEGLERTATDVLVRIESLGGSSTTTRLRPVETSFQVPAEPGVVEIAQTYLRLGIEHILGGIDHLLFVLALLLIVNGWRRLVATITSFTIAHSITLALASLGVVHIPAAPVEATIALSILFLASELARGRLGRPGMAERSPWIVAFSFGLLHGFGFAGALSEIGLPEGEIPLALLLFNVGVELGQMVFVGVVLACLWGARRLEVKGPEWGWPDWSWPEWSWMVPTYLIGGVASYWTLERISSFW